MANKKTDNNDSDGNHSKKMTPTTKENPKPTKGTKEKKKETNNMTIEAAFKNATNANDGKEGKINKKLEGKGDKALATQKHVKSNNLFSFVVS